MPKNTLPIGFWLPLSIMAALFALLVFLPVLI